MTTPLTAEQLSPWLVVFSLGGEDLTTGYGVNCTAFAGRDATVVVDPMVAPAHARLVDDALRRRGFPPVRWVVATHHHTDHALGASVFVEQGAKLVAHREAAVRMAAEHPALIAARRRIPALRDLFEGAVACAPDVAIDRPFLIDVGDQGVEVRPLGHAHSPGDCAVLFGAEGAVCCGDVLHAGYHFNYEDADLQHLADALLALGGLAERGFLRFIPGHGPSGDRALIDAQRTYHEEVARLVASSATAAAAQHAIRARWPGWRLESTIATATLRRWP